MLFLNALRETRTEREDLDNTASEMRQMAPYFPQIGQVSSHRNTQDPDFVNIFGARQMFWDFDGLWERFMNDCHLLEAATRCGMRMKSENSIVDKWPLRLKQNPTLEEVKRRHASGRTGSERYVEFTRMA
jgi:hypothetical protein